MATHVYHGIRYNCQQHFRETSSSPHLKFKLLCITRVPQDKPTCKTSVKKLFSLNMANDKIQCWACFESKRSFWRSCKAGYFWFYDFEKACCLKWKQNAYSKMTLRSPSQACLCLENQYAINLLNNTLQRSLSLTLKHFPPVLPTQKWSCWWSFWSLRNVWKS